ncbi:MAG TPA: hypothetical protein VH814_00530 [Steroidobacteraceae bacterium]
MITNREKILIGGVGAVCLGLLKLIGANFYLAEASGAVALGAYLTYGAYLVFGMAVAFFFAEDGPDKPKVRRSAFVMGLLAPSVLIAIVSKAPEELPLRTVTPADVPTLGSMGAVVVDGLFGSAAYAQTVDKASVVDIAQATAPQGVADGVRSALGRAATPQNYLFVLGKTRNKELAVAEAGRINDVLSRNEATKDLNAVVLTSADTAEIYISVGLGLTAEQAIETKRLSAQSAVATLQEGASKDEVDAAAKLLRGQIVRGADLRR